MAFKERSDRRVRYGRVIGLLFLVLGALTIFLGWNGMASRACPDCQLPYLISGGFGGLAMIVVGAALLVVSGLRAERLHLQDTLHAVAQASAKVSAGELEAGAVSPNGRVVIGRSTYHRPDCRLVRGKADLDLVTVEQAAATGLSPCRVCNPTRVEEPAAT